MAVGAVYIPTPRKTREGWGIRSVVVGWEVKGGAPGTGPIVSIEPVHSGEEHVCFKVAVGAVFAFLCLMVFCAQCCMAQEWSNKPTTWWRDPATGLMWTGDGIPHSQIIVLRDGMG